jgi:hypothetical protein
VTPEFFIKQLAISAIKNIAGGGETEPLGS